MRPDDIRRLYAAEEAATASEAARTREEARTDPEAARKLLRVLYAMSTEDRDFAMLLRLFLEGMTMRLIEERAASDDQFALECAKLITDLMDATMKKTPRGKPRTAKTA